MSAPGSGTPGRGFVAVHAAPGDGRTAFLAAARRRVAEQDGGAVAAVACSVSDEHAKSAALRRLTDALPAPGDRPDRLLITVDDAQWADDATLEALTALALEPRQLRATVLVAVRDGEPAARRPALTALLDVAERRVDLAPLSRDGVAVLAGQRLCDGIHAASGGSPLLVTALLAAGVADVVPPAVEAFAAEWLSRLGDDERALARACAVAAPCALSLAAAAAGLDILRAAAAADALATARLLAPGEPLRYAQPVVARAVLAGIPPFERAELHRRAAAVLDDDGAPAGDIAAHLLHATPHGDARSVVVLRAAARCATERGDRDEAVALLTRAAAEPPPAGNRIDTLLELGWARLAAREEDPAAPLRDAMQRPDAVVLARDWHRLARLLMAGGDVEGAGAAAARAAGASTDAETAEIALADVLTVGVMKPPLDPCTRSRLDDLAARARVGRFPSSPALRAALALYLAGTAAKADVVERLALHALTDERLLADDRLAGGLTFATAALVAADTRADLWALLDEAVAVASARGWEPAAAAASGWRALLLLRDGRQEEARRESAALFDVAATPFSPHLMLAAPLIVETHVELRALDEAEAVLGRIHRRTPMRLHARGTLRLARGDAEAALADFRNAGTIFAAIGVLSPAVAPWRSSAALAAHRLGRHEEAMELAGAEVSLARRIGDRRPLAIALRACGLVRGRDGLGALEDAVALLEASPSRVAHLRALLDLGGARRRAGLRAEAREPLARAYELATTCGAAAIAAEAKAQLHAAGARPRRTARSGEAALTASERRVAELAADGLASADIAQQLFVSRKTVESHLHRAYRKLGIKSRGELAGLLAPDASPSDA